MFLLTLFLSTSLQVSETNTPPDEYAATPPHTMRDRGPSPLEVEIESLPRASGYEQDPDFFQRFFPLFMNQRLDKRVDSHLIPFFLSGTCCCIGGSIWFPLLFMDTQTPEGYLSDACLSWGLHGVTQVGIIFLLQIFSIVFPPLSGLSGPGCMVFTLANAFYLMPIASINTYDRLLKHEKRRIRLQERSKKSKKKSKGEKKSHSSQKNGDGSKSKTDMTNTESASPSTDVSPKDESSSSPKGTGEEPSDDLPPPAPLEENNGDARFPPYPSTQTAQRY